VCAGLGSQPVNSSLTRLGPGFGIIPAVRRLVVLSLMLFIAVPATAQAALPPINHVFIVVLENKDYDATFADDSKAPYLAKTLPAQGQLLTQYYGTGHLSLDNYITMVSGQPPNPVTQSDCQFFQDFVGTMREDGVAVGQGCVYPPEVRTIGDQLEAADLTWKGYAEDMGTPCRHPQINARDDTQSAKADDQYAARHNPFVYFHSIIDRPICATNVLDLKELDKDLASKDTTATYSFITPDLCSDGHDEPCIDGRPGGLESVNVFLQEWIPKITGSPAYKDGGLVIVTFDEAENDASDCCNEPMGPNTPNNGGEMPGNGGGRIGAVLLSPYIKPGSTNDTPYNHYALLRSTEDLFSLPHLAYAGQEGLKPFGDDVFNATPPGDGGGAGKKPSIKITKVPRRCVSKPFRPRVTIKTSAMRNANVFVDRRRVAKSKRKSFRPRIRVKGLRAGKHLLTVRAADRSDRRARKTRMFRVCAR
jgi:hypothetical protein